MKEREGINWPFWINVAVFLPLLLLFIVYAYRDHEDALREHYLWVNITVERSSKEIEYADLRPLDKKFSTRSLCQNGAAELAKLVEKELKQRQDIKQLTSGDSWVMYLAPIGHDFIYGVPINRFGIVEYNYLCLPHNIDIREKK